MIPLTDRLYIGDSGDEERADLASLRIGAVLNVAQDLQGTRGWKCGVEYMQVGLIDGPGNPPAAYYSAVLALTALLNRSRVLVCCHTGGRALAVAIMYLNANAQSQDWERWLEILRERVDVGLPVPHDAHRREFNRMNWRLLARFIGD